MAGKKPPVSKYLRAWRQYLKRMTKTQLARYESLLAGRVGRDGEPLAVYPNVILAETVELVYLESELDGACCQTCRQEAWSKNTRRLQPIPQVRAWEGRKLTVEELAARIQALKASNPLKREMRPRKELSRPRREALCRLPDAGAPAGASQVAETLIGQMCVT